jgi:hypothetical protein
LGARADLFAAHNIKQAHDVVAAVAAAPPLEQEERTPRWQWTVGVPHSVARGQARIGSGLCFSHFCYEARAKKCEAPCTWSGN